MVTSRLGSWSILSFLLAIVPKSSGLIFLYSSEFFDFRIYKFKSTAHINCVNLLLHNVFKDAKLKQKVK